MLYQAYCVITCATEEKLVSEGVVSLEIGLWRSGLFSSGFFYNLSDHSSVTVTCNTRLLSRQRFHHVAYVLYIAPLDKQQRTQKCIIFYSSTVTFVCSRNTVWEISLISFFYGRYHFHEVVRQPENTLEELPGLLEWPAGLSLHLRDQQISFSPKLQTLYCLFKSHVDMWTSSVPHVFFCSWLVIGTYILLFFPGNLLILSANGNIYHFIHKQWIIFSASSFIFLFPVKPLCWCSLAIALNLHSSSSPANLVY